LVSDLEEKSMQLSSIKSILMNRDGAYERNDEAREEPEEDEEQEDEKRSGDELTAEMSSGDEGGNMLDEAF
jgi:hypothetical protein